jgi:hypothetical protein
MPRGRHAVVTRPRSRVVVNRASDHSTAGVWVHVGNHRPATGEPTTLGRERGRVSGEGFGA